MSSDLISRFRIVLESAKKFKHTGCVVSVKDLELAVQLLSGKTKTDTAYKQKSSDRTCAHCDSPMKLRKGIHGQFYGCSSYPECRYTEQLGEVYD